MLFRMRLSPAEVSVYPPDLSVSPCQLSPMANNKTLENMWGRGEGCGGEERGGLASTLKSRGMLTWTLPEMLNHS